LKFSASDWCAVWVSVVKFELLMKWNLHIKEKTIFFMRRIKLDTSNFTLMIITTWGDIIEPIKFSPKPHLTKFHQMVRYSYSLFLRTNFHSFNHNRIHCLFFFFGTLHSLSSKYVMSILQMINHVQIDAQYWLSSI
jgi:hypothetical protein